MKIIKNITYLFFFYDYAFKCFTIKFVNIVYYFYVIESLLMCGDDVEIIIVNDGSTDKTAEIAKNYLKNNSNIKFIDKENGGHGSGINAGLKICEGLYFKCVDSDDWIDHEAYKKLIKVIKENYNKNSNPDLYLTNYVYERVDIISTT